MPRQWLFNCRSLTLNIIYTFHIILIATLIFGIINASTIKANITQALEHTNNKCRSTINSNITQALEQTNKCRSTINSNITKAVEQTNKCRSTINSNITKAVGQINKCRSNINSNITQAVEQTNKCHSLPTEDIWNPTCTAPNGQLHPSPHSFSNYSPVATPRAITGHPLEWNNINKGLDPARHLGISSSEINIECWLMHLVVSEADLKDAPIIQCSIFDGINISDSLRAKDTDLCLNLEGLRRWVPSVVETFSPPIGYRAIGKFFEGGKLLSNCDREDTTEL